MDRDDKVIEHFLAGENLCCKIIGRLFYRCIEKHRLALNLSALFFLRNLYHYNIYNNYYADVHTVAICMRIARIMARACSLDNIGIELDNMNNKTAICTVLLFDFLLTNTKK